MRTTILTPPVNPAVTWNMVRQHLRLDELDPEVLDAEQTYCMNLVDSATRTARSITRCALIETEYELDLLPGELNRRPYSGFRFWRPGQASILELDWPPLQEVETITLGETLLIENTDYWIWKTADGTPTLPGTISFRAGLFGDACCCSCACEELANAQPLRVLYTAGFGETAEDVPADVRSWILLRVGALYENREEAAEVRNIVTMPFVDSLLSNERWFQFS